LLVAGVVVFAYPRIAQWHYAKEARRIIEKFDESAADLNRGTAESTVDLTGLHKAMQAYNQVIYEEKQENLNDIFAYQVASFDLAQWGLEENLVGYIEVPRMRVQLPIYLGATDSNMSRGAVHLSQTSLPIGGKNTNSVIAAHRGWSTAAMFRDIEYLQTGDEIFITNLWETLTYRVTEIKVIDPSDIHEVRIQSDKDMVTLLTCHPYAQNYQRYIVYCERD
jgi:sortase A